MDVDWGVRERWCWIEPVNGIELVFWSDLGICISIRSSSAGLLDLYGARNFVWRFRSGWILGVYFVGKRLPILVRLRCNLGRNWLCFSRHFRALMMSERDCLSVLLLLLLESVVILAAYLGPCLMNMDSCFFGWRLLWQRVKKWCRFVWLKERNIMDENHLWKKRKRIYHGWAMQFDSMENNGFSMTCTVSEPGFWKGLTSLTSLTIHEGKFVWNSTARGERWIGRDGAVLFNVSGGVQAGNCFDKLRTSLLRTMTFLIPVIRCFGDSFQTNCNDGVQLWCLRFEVLLCVL